MHAAGHSAGFGVGNSAGTKGESAERISFLQINPEVFVMSKIFFNEQTRIILAAVKMEVILRC